jgi:hypothetical protein
VSDRAGGGWRCYLHPAVTAVRLIPFILKRPSLRFLESKWNFCLSLGTSVITLTASLFPTIEAIEWDEP